MYLTSHSQTFSIRVISDESNKDLCGTFQVVEAALLSRIQRWERRLMDLEPRVSMRT